MMTFDDRVYDFITRERSNPLTRWGALGQHNLPEKKVQWLVCGSISSGAGGAAAIRECKMIGCENDVCVPSFLLTLVESGELWPRCWACHVENGGDLKLHPAVVEILATGDELAAVQAIVADMNEAAQEEREASKILRMIEQDELENDE